MNVDWRRVLVTGGAGFIGSHLVDRLMAETTAEIVVLDNLSRGRLMNIARHRSSPRFQLIEGDVRDPETVRSAVAGVTVVFHLAAQSTVMGGVADGVYNFGSNVTGVFNVLRAASLAEARRVVFSSSREVYGDPIVVPVDEGHPLLPVNQYGASKVAGEAYCRAFRRENGLDTVILRFGNVFGSRDFGRVIPRWLELAEKGEDLVVYGGRQVLDLVWVDDAVDALMCAARASGPLPPINVASGAGTTIMDLANRIAEMSAGRSRVQVQPARTMEVVQFIGAVDRLRDMLGLQPSTDALSKLELLMPAGAATLAPH